MSILSLKVIVVVSGQREKKSLSSSSVSIRVWGIDLASGIT